MSLDPTLQPHTQHDTHIDQAASHSTLTSAQHVSAHESARSSDRSGTAGVTESPGSARDKGKQRQTDTIDDADASTIVRVVDPDAAQDALLEAGAGTDAPGAASTITDDSELAPELLMRIFAFLDPISLCRSAAVCRAWAFVARDDSTWRAAFATYFSLEAAQANRSTSLEASATPALRRLTDASWRHEFQQRVDLLRRWRKSRTPTVLSTPRVDIIKKISLSKQHRLLISATDTYGVASRSNPWTGKVTKGYLDAEGTANGAGNGNPNVEFSPNVTTLNTSSDASHIYWGFRSGEVGMTTMARQGTNPRGAIKSIRFTPRACHAGPVSAIAIPFASDSDGAHGPGRSPERLRQAIASLGDVASTFVTAGFDGTVRMWTSNRSWPLWIASSATKPATIDGVATTTPAAAPICALAYDAKAGIVAAGNTAGRLFVWTNIDVAGLLRIPPEASDPEHLRNGNPEPHTLKANQEFSRLSDAVRRTVIDVPVGPSSEVAVSSIFIDASPPSTAKGMEDVSEAHEAQVLVHHSGARVLLRHRIPRDASRDIETTVLGAAVMDEITAIRPDFEPRLPKRDVRSSTAQSPATSVYASPVLSAARPEMAVPSLNSVAPTLVLGPSPFDTYAGSGQYAERKYVCVGTKSGSLFLFDWQSTGTILDETTQQEWQGQSPTRFRGQRQLLPSIGWEAHHTTISALELTPLHIFVGASDGTIKVFDSLAGDLIRTINDRTATRHPARMLAAGEMTASEAARFRVTQIIADNDCLVASIGHQVLAFRAEPVLSKRAAAAANAAAKKGGRPRVGESKYATQVELKRDVRESKAELEAEHEERQAEYSKIRSRQGFELDGLSEQEALEYALMLSRDQEAATASSKAKFMGGSGYVPGSYASSSRKKIEVPEEVVDDPELADALEQIALAESKAEAQAAARWGMLDDDDFGTDDPELDEMYVRSSPSPSPHASPYLSAVSPPSRAWTILSQAGSSATAPNTDRWGSNSKVRMVNVPRSARLSSPTPAEASIASSLSSSMGALSPPEWPAMPPSNPGSLSASPRFGERRASGAASPGARPTLQPRPSAWATRSQAVATLPPTQSLLAASLQTPQSQSRDADAQLQQDIDLAIQLSLAEAEAQ
ncbi:cdc4 and related F-box and WD-40 proteins [Moesziomyces antarcticus T-34]|uniref:Cdc4 and related F-box and WD-40 proteins n=1 Tax=Pseudozyma antarctica (strain T-34) TaxID=1151754 RepID=M9LX60_PSEA3|nr:cdc4 and related F-box and WD-40 proteins [Moesziomyces antarcticus T-34]